MPQSAQSEGGRRRVGNGIFVELFRVAYGKEEGDESAVSGKGRGGDVSDG